MKKRISAICLALAVMISLTTPTFAASAKRPTLTSVSVGDGILNAEDMEYDYAVTRSRVPKETAAELHLQVTETGSGIDYVKARFLGDNGRGISLTLAPADGEYVGYLSASQLKYEGTYTLQRVMLKDRAGNRSVLTGFETIRIEVVSEPAFKEAAA